MIYGIMVHVRTLQYPTYYNVEMQTVPYGGRMVWYHTHIHDKYRMLHTYLQSHKELSTVISLFRTNGRIGENRE
jgi:hypothetical protein